MRPVDSGIGVLSRRLRRFWDTLRRLTGDDAYERYLEAFRDHSEPGGQPLGRRAFQAERVARRWSRITRCC